MKSVKHIIDDFVLNLSGDCVTNYIVNNKDDTEIVHKAYSIYRRFLFTNIFDLIDNAIWFRRNG